MKLKMSFEALKRFGELPRAGVEGVLLVNRKGSGLSAAIFISAIC